MDAIRAYREQDMMGNSSRKVAAYDELTNTDIQYLFVNAEQ